MKSLLNDDLPMNVKCWFLKTTPMGRRTALDRTTLLFCCVRHEARVTSPPSSGTVLFDRSNGSSYRETSTGGSGSDSDSGRSGCRHDVCNVKRAGVTFRCAGFLHYGAECMCETALRYDLESCTRIYYILCY